MAKGSFSQTHLDILCSQVASFWGRRVERDVNDVRNECGRARVIVSRDGKEPEEKAPQFLRDSPVGAQCPESKDLLSALLGPCPL